MSTDEKIATMSNTALKSLIATINPNGSYGHWVEKAKAELRHRGVSYANGEAGVQE